MAIRSYRDLLVWQRAMKLTEDCYRLTASLPRSERFGLTSQIQRAAVSIAANIAEGHGRKYTKEYIRHLSIAAGSLAELETHLMIAARLQMTPESAMKDPLKACSEVGRMLESLKRSLNAKAPAPRP